MDNQIPPSKLVAPSVVFKESDVAHTNTQIEASNNASLSVQSEQSRPKKATTPRYKISPKYAGNLPFKVYYPCSKPVSLGELLNEISMTIRMFVIIDPVQADAIALWIFLTYIFNLFDTNPLLIMNAPERACAKTLLQTVIAELSARALMASNATPSTLFRSVELWMPTIFFDEVDTFFKENNELLGMVNAGYKSSGFVLRSEKTEDTYTPKKFPVFGAKSLAGIALERHLPDSTMSRAIIINMRRKLSGETVTRLRYAEPGLFKKLCAKLERAADDYAEAIQHVRPHLPDALSDRGQDNWEPLLAIATVAGADWLERATHAALTLSKQSNEKVSTGNELLSDIQSIFEDRRHGKQHWDKISSSELITELEHIPESPWATYNQGRPIAPRQLSSQLAVYGIKSKTVRLGPHDTPKGYELSQFEDAFARYLNTTDTTVPEAVQDEDTSIDTPAPADSRLY